MSGQGNHDIDCKLARSSKKSCLFRKDILYSKVDQNGCEGYDSLYIRIIKIMMFLLQMYFRQMEME